MVISNNILFCFKILIILFCVLLGAQITFAQSGGKILGKVTDKMTGAPIPGVNVLLEGTTMGGASDLNGEFFIINIPPDVYNIKVSNIGYKTLIVQSVRVNANRTTELDVQIEETILELQEAATIIADRPLVQKDGTSTRHFVTTRICPPSGWCSST